ncbi:MAG: hypothetical protein BWZ07_02082 [Alphaproteobacteria bacterium ADurb.BinA280]|nr:MAG: hypothetical protein BWZ07_02082 [Alphaproteobacteria bacterium ADurb.BinA280]
MPAWQPLEPWITTLRRILRAHHLGQRSNPHHPTIAALRQRLDIARLARLIIEQGSQFGDCPRQDFVIDVCARPNLGNQLFSTECGSRMLDQSSQQTIQ